MEPKTHLEIHTNNAAGDIQPERQATKLVLPLFSDKAEQMAGLFRHRNLEVLPLKVQLGEELSERVEDGTEGSCRRRCADSF